MEKVPRVLVLLNIFCLNWRLCPTTFVGVASVKEKFYHFVVLASIPYSYNDTKCIKGVVGRIEMRVDLA